MTAPRPPLSVTAFVGGLLILLGVASLGLYGFTSGREAHSYAGAPAPSSVLLQRGNTYSVGVPHGVRAEMVAGLDPGTLACSLTSGGRELSISLQADQTDTKATTQIATFVSPVSGRASITCPGLTRVFVDNAVDAPFDLAGLWLLVAAASLALGLPLGLSALRAGRRDQARRATTTRSSDVSMSRVAESSKGKSSAVTDATS